MPTPGAAAAAWASARRIEASRKTYSVAMADHRSRGVDRSPRAARAPGDGGHDGAAGDSWSGVSRRIQWRRPSWSACRASWVCRGRRTPTRPGWCRSGGAPRAAEPAATASSGADGRSPPSTTGIISRPAVGRRPPRSVELRPRPRTRSVGGHLLEGPAGAWARPGGRPAARPSRRPRRACRRRAARSRRRPGGRGPGAAGAASRAATLMPPADSPNSGDVARVAAEVGDVVPHPRERGHLVGQAPVARIRSTPAVEPRSARARPAPDGPGSPSRPSR